MLPPQNMCDALSNKNKDNKENCKTANENNALNMQKSCKAEDADMMKCYIDNISSRELGKVIKKCRKKLKCQVCYVIKECM